VITPDDERQYVRNRPKRALITGCTGQDGHYLAQHLTTMGYKVYGGYRRSSNMTLPDIERVPLEMTEYESIRRAVKSVRPDEIYNLAAQSHVGESFGSPQYTTDVDYLGVLRLLELLRDTKIRLYQASTSEMFGGGRNLSEESPFAPRSPYGVAKLAAHHLCTVYRKGYGVRVSCGILFNHESPLRGKEFVTRKITWNTANHKKFTLANLDSIRDWGHAKDYVRAMQMMLQYEPDDFVIATGKAHTIQDFINEVKDLGFEPNFEVVEATQRPWDVTELHGDPSKAIEKLGWLPMYNFKALVKDMMYADANIREAA